MITCRHYKWSVPFPRRRRRRKRRAGGINVVRCPCVGNAKRSGSGDGAKVSSTPTDTKSESYVKKSSAPTRISPPNDWRNANWNPACLALALMPVVGGRQGDAPLFLSRREKRLSADNFVKRELKPILNKLGLDGALHAFRHGNATALDHMNAPLKVRHERLGHVAAKTTMAYTHLVSEDDRLLSEKRGKILCPNVPKLETERLDENAEGLLIQ